MCGALGIATVDEDDDGNAAGRQPVSTDQHNKLQHWIKVSGVNLEDFLTWAECEALEAFPADRYQEAVALLKRRSKKGEGV